MIIIIVFKDFGWGYIVQALISIKGAKNAKFSNINLREQDYKKKSHAKNKASSGNLG
jgi:hypothetical protein